MRVYILSGNLQALLSMSPDLPTNTDGRVARRDRTRRAIVEAHLALLEEGELRPTGARIASRAGVSTRAVWLVFKDMEALMGAVAEEVFQRMQAERRPIDATLPLPERIEAYCRERGRLLEILTPYARASIARSSRSDVLRRYEQRHVRGFAREIEEVFASELPVAPPTRARYVQALTVATTWASWSGSRELLDLDIDGAVGVMARTFTDVLAGAARAR